MNFFSIIIFVIPVTIGIYIEDIHHKLRSNLTMTTWTIVGNKSISDYFKDKKGYMVSAKLTHTGLISSTKHTVKELVDEARKHHGKKKGLRIDITQENVFYSHLMKALGPVKKGSFPFPLWIHADVVPEGRRDENKLNLLFNNFLDYTDNVLCLGWTMSRYHFVRAHGYNWRQIHRMLIAAKRFKLDQVRVAFSIRARLVKHPRNIEQFSMLLDQTPGSQLYVWANPGEVEDQTLVRIIRLIVGTFGFDKVWIDVPPKLYVELKLHTLGKCTMILGVTKCYEKRY